MDIRKGVLECIKDIKGGYVLSEINLISDKYISSFELLELIVKLEDFFKIEIPRDDLKIKKWNSVDLIADLIKNNLEIEKGAEE